MHIQREEYNCYLCGFVIKWPFFSLPYYLPK